jgi:hypothetical protein
MPRLISVPALAASFLVLLLPLAAGAVLIDNFETSQTVQVGPGGANSASGGVATAGNSLGDARAVQVSRLEGTGILLFDANNSTMSVGETAASPSAAGTITMLYDGNTDDVLDETGLGGVDLTDGGTLSQLSITLRSDLDATITFVVFSDASNASFFVLDFDGQGLDPTPFQQVVIPFASFGVALGAGADFSSVGAFGIEIESPRGLDLQIDQIETIVPEPSAIVLACLGLAGLGFASRRRTSRS